MTTRIGRMVPIGNVLGDGGLVVADLRARAAVARLYRPDGDKGLDLLDARCPECQAWAGYVCRDRDDEACGPHAGRAQAAQEIAEQRERRQRAEVADRLKRADVPPRLVRALRVPLETEPLAVAREWRASGASTLLLVGARGIGKSVAAAWCVGEGPRGGGPARWISATELASLDFYGAETELGRLRRVPLLVVDELDGGEQGREASFRARIEALFCFRHDRELETVWTSNRNAEELAPPPLPDGSPASGGLGERVIDRIRDDNWLYECETIVSLRGTAT